MNKQQTFTTHTWSLQDNKSLTICCDETTAQHIDDAFTDAERWRWLRQQGGWPESEAAMSEATPKEFDALADKARGEK